MFDYINYSKPRMGHIIPLTQNTSFALRRTLCFSSFGVRTILVKFIPKNFSTSAIFLNGLFIPIFTSSWLFLMERIALLSIHLPCPHDRNSCSNSRHSLLCQIRLLRCSRHTVLSSVERAKLSSSCHICRGHRAPSALAAGFQAREKGTFAWFSKGHQAGKTSQLSGFHMAHQAGPGPRSIFSVLGTL